MDRRSLLAGGLGLATTAALAAPGLAPTALAQVQALPFRDQRLVRQAADYLQGLKTAKARFVQTSSRGGTAAGTLYLNRPGKARFEYDPPSQMLVVSDGRDVSIYDRRLKTFDKYPLGATPLGIFLARRISLQEDVKVTGLAHTDDGFSITVMDAHAQADGRMIMDFAAQPIALRGWTIVDGQGVETRVQLSGMVAGGAFDPYLFVLADPRKRLG